MTAHRVHVGTIGEGIFRSLDGGETFRRAAEGMFVECHVRALVLDPRDARTLYLGSEQGLFVSRNGADHWDPVDSPLNGKQIWSILLHPANPDLMLAGTCPAQIFRSLDGGKTWSERPARLEQHCPRIMHTRVTCFLGGEPSPQTLWAGVEIDGLWRSTDQGETWEPAGSGLSSRDIHGLVRLAAAGGKPERLLATTNNDINASDDGGLTWRPLNIGRWLPHSYCRALGLLPGRPEKVLLGNGDGPPGSTGLIATSSDRGESWQIARMPGSANSTIWNFASHPADPQLVYASSVSGEVFRSTDAGATWVKLTREFGEIRGLAWAPE
jgi:Sortilin, neurotensin receptor 3,/BNR/Asp-box repeat